MRTYTIDNDNNITVFATKKEAAAASVTPFDSFTNQVELAELTTDWPMQRLVELWNGIPGVNAITKFTSRKIASDRIWKAIQNLGATPAQQISEAACDNPEPAPEAAAEQPIEPALDPATTIAETVTAWPTDISESPAAQIEAEAPATVAAPEPVPSVDAVSPAIAPAETESSKIPVRAKKAPKSPKVAKAAKSESGPREGSKTRLVITMLQREGGVTLAEIMSTMGWQKHTVRGFMAGSMKKAGYTVQSFKPEGGERSYRINK